MRALQAEALSPQARISYLGHATTLIETGGLRLLTDPVLRPRIAHLRRRAPLPDPANLGRIDAVLVSHAHHDHLDPATIHLLPGAPPVVGPRSVASTLAKLDNPFQSLEAGGSTTVGAVSIEGVLADHDGGRRPILGSQASIGFLVSAVAGDGVYFAGDTDIYAGMRELRGRVEVALIPVAGWGPRVGPGHLDPVSAARTVALIRPRRAIPIHWGTYRRIGMDASPAVLREPAESFRRQLSELAPEVVVEVLEPGGVASGDPGEAFES